MTQPNPIEAAYEIAKLHAATDQSFAEPLMRHWFNAAWEVCADAAGFVYPARQVTETVTVNQRDGSIKLSGEPTSEVRLFSNGVLVAVLPPNAPQLDSHRNLPNPYDYPEGWDVCMPASLCCYCTLTAQYNIGQPAGDVCSQQISPAFVQAVAQLFAHMVENRGDVKMDDQILTRSGAKGFLAPHLTYVA